MQKLFGTLLIAVIISALGFWWFNVWQNEPTEKEEPRAEEVATTTPEESSAIDTADWETYTNTTYGFSLKYPREWRLNEASDDSMMQAFTIYAPKSATGSLPFTHHSEDATHVSVYPDGIPTEGLFGTTASSTLDLRFETTRATDYLLKDGTPYATFVYPKNPGAEWKEYGFIFGGMPIENHTFECFSKGARIPNNKCDPLMGDDIVHMGSVNKRDRAIIEQILESVTLTTQKNGAQNGTASSSYKDLIRVDAPRPESTVSSPLTIRGEARGTWFFEATFPIVLTDWDGRIIAEGHAEAKDTWMTKEYVPFEATLTFNATTSVSNRGSLILQKANASGLPEHADAFEYTIFFAETP